MVGDSDSGYQAENQVCGFMPLRAMRSDGADHPGAALKPRLSLRSASALLAAGSACPFPGSRGYGRRDGSSRNHGSACGEAVRLVR